MGEKAVQDVTHENKLLNLSNLFTHIAQQTFLRHSALDDYQYNIFQMLRDED